MDHPENRAAGLVKVREPGGAEGDCEPEASSERSISSRLSGLTGTVFCQAAVSLVAISSKCASLRGGMGSFPDEESTRCWLEPASS